MEMLPAILAPAALGSLVLALLLRNDRNMGPLLRIGLAFPLGMGLVTVQMFLLGVLRVPLTLISVASLVSAEIVVLGLIAWRTGAPLLSSGQALPTLRTWPAKLAVAAFAGWAMLKIGSVFVETLLRPIYAWDAWANWSAGAKAFYYAKSLLLDAPAPYFFGKGAVFRIVEYPLHNSLSQVWFALWAGTFDEVLVKLSSPAYLLSMALVLYDVASRKIGRLLALLLLVVFLSSPLLSYHAIEVYSDLPLGMYLCLTLVAFLLAMGGNRSAWVLIGLFSALALFTKDEAPFFVLPLLASALVFLYGKRGIPAGSRRPALLALFLPLLLAAPWFLFKLYYGIGTGAGIKVVFTFHPEVIEAMVLNLLSLNNFLAIPLFFVLFLGFSGKPEWEFLHLFLPLAIFIAFFTSVYALTTFYFEQFSNGTVFFRNVLTWYPSLCLLVALEIRKVLPADWRAPLGALQSE